MRELILLTAVLILFSNCSSEISAPEGIIPDTTMSDLLVEFTLADAAYNVSLTDPTSVRFKPELFYESALKKYGYSREEFNRSIRWYSENTKQLLKVYDNALIDLSQRESALNH